VVGALLINGQRLYPESEAEVTPTSPPDIGAATTSVARCIASRAGGTGDRAVGYDDLVRTLVAAGSARARQHVANAKAVRLPPIRSLADRDTEMFFLFPRGTRDRGVERDSKESDEADGGRTVQYHIVDKSDHMFHGVDEPGEFLRRDGRLAAERATKVRMALAMIGNRGGGAPSGGLARLPAVSFDKAQRCSATTRSTGPAVQVSHATGTFSWPVGRSSADAG